MNDAQYYMRVRGRVQGPFDQEKLKSFSRRGQLSRMHEVSTDGINWARASNFPELFVGTVSESAAAPPPDAAPPAPAAPSQSAPAPASPPAPPVAANPAPARPEWWYTLNGKQQGPVEFAALQQLTASGQLGQLDFVWKSGMTGWRPAAEISGLTFAGIQPPRSDYQSLGGTVQTSPIEEMLYRSALRSRPRALLLAVAICLSAGGCCLWSLWQFFFASVRDSHAGWSLFLGALGLIESGVLAAAAILLSIHAGRLAGLRHSRQLVVLEKALAALRPFWLLAAIAVLLALVLISLFLLTLSGAPAPVAAGA